MDIVLKSVRSSKKQKSRNVKECFECGEKIFKGQEYINHQFRYSGRVITVYFCAWCLDERKSHVSKIF